MNEKIKDVSHITTCRSFAVKKAFNYITNNKDRPIALLEVKKELNLNASEIQIVRRELNKLNKEKGRLRYLTPSDSRLVIYIPSSEKNPQILLATEAALLNLDLDKNEQALIRNNLKNFLKELTQQSVNKG